MLFIFIVSAVFQHFHHSWKLSQPSIIWRFMRMKFSIFLMYFNPTTFSFISLISRKKITTKNATKKLLIFSLKKFLLSRAYTLHSSLEFLLLFLINLRIFLLAFARIKPRLNDTTPQHVDSSNRTEQEKQPKPIWWQC